MLDEVTDSLYAMFGFYTSDCLWHSGGIEPTDWFELGYATIVDLVGSSNDRTLGSLSEYLSQTDDRDFL